MTPPDDAFAGRAWKFWTEPTIVEVDGNPTAYRRAGSGPTLVYLHGGGNTRAWLPIHEELSLQFDLIAPEHPGYGDTPRAEEQDSWQDYVLHYDAFFRALDLQDIHLVGTSLGAWLAANLAVHYPGRFRSLTLITPLGTRIEDEPFIDFFRLTPEEALAALYNGRADRYLDQLEQEGQFEDAVHAYGEASTSALLMWVPRYDLKFDSRLRRVVIPTLVLAAGDDRLVGNRQATRFAELIPGAELTTLKGPDGEASSHGMVTEQPAEVTSAIADHIAKGA